MFSRILRTGILPVLLAVAFMLASCGDLKKGAQVMPPTEQITAAEWKIISRKRVFFGHQSVGNNILSGVKTLAGQAGVNLKIIESRTAPTECGITHFKIGKNEDPRSKIKDFSDTLNSGVVQGADIALMKLCYIDIKGYTDAKKLAEEYISALDRLGRQFPKTVFIAVTAPLRTVQSGPRSLVRCLLGRDPGGYAENLRRQEFNAVLRDMYGRQGKLFDLARFEAEGAGSHQYKGQPLEVLNPAISNDGGHLNAHGEQYIAAKLLKLLASGL